MSRLLAGIAALAIATSGVQVPTGWAAEIEDATGQIVKTGDISRLLSIGGDTTEILYALGFGDNVVAVDTMSQFPAAAMAKTKVGYMRALSTEGVLSTGATLILANSHAGPPEVMRALKASSVPVVILPVGLFRNPLADPGLIGVSSGAALAAVATIALGSSFAGPWVRVLGVWALPLAAFLGGFVTTMALMLIARRHGTTAIATLLLAGIALGALAGALTGLLAYVTDDRELRDLTLWSMGSLAGASWQKVLGIAPFALLLLLTIPRLVRALNGLLLGEAEAFYLGVEVEGAKLRVVTLAAAAVGAAVAVAGTIGFVGIVVPHLVRLIAGPDHRVVLPASALLGAVLVVVADVAARMIVAPAELPVGIIMAVIGAPVFLHLVIRRGGLLSAP